VRRALAVVAALLFGGSALAQARDWAFLQSVGGLALGVPVERNGAWQLPIRANVSGLEPVTTAPTAVHPTLSCTTRVKVEGEAIVLTVLTHAEAHGGGAACPAARLGALTKGRYEVFYSGSADERVKVGEIFIAR
jgi:hypothetical protein